MSALGSQHSRFVTGIWSAALTLASLALGSPLALALEWQIEIVDDAINWIGSSIGIAVSDDGTPHIGHGSHPSQIIRYAVKSGGTWVIEPADGYPSGLGAAIALDPDGQPCLAYLKGSVLYFARRTTGGWTTHELVDVMSATHCSLKVFEDGVPHIAYSAPNDPWALRHAWKPGTSWLTETADGTVAAGHDIDLVLDEAGRPHVSHWAAPNYGAGPFHQKYTWWDGSTWQHKVIDAAVENCNVIQSGLALDADGHPHIAHFTHKCLGPSALKYAFYDGTTWAGSPIEPSLPSSAVCSLVLDRTGSPHVVYGTGYSMAGGNSKLRYAHLDQGTWVTEPIDAGADAGELNSLAIDPQGFLHVAYFAGDGATQSGKLCYARSKTPVAYMLGDLNCDGRIDAFDIDPFVLALTDPAGYEAAWPDCDRMLADINDDGKVDAFDIDPFVDLLTGG